MGKKYSVLMTVYKGDVPEYFRTALLSMTTQTLAPDEIVIVKDGYVPCDIQNVIDSVAGQSPCPIRQVQLPCNMGLGGALNAGLEVCRNELIARMDADDISSPERCAKQVAEFEKNLSLDVLGCPVIEFIDNIDNSVGIRNVPLDNESIYTFCRKRDPFNHPTVMYKKSKVDAVGGYSDLRKNQDTDLWIKMLANGAVCANLPEPLLYFRFDEKTYMKRKNWLNTKILIKLRWKAFRSGFCSFVDFVEVAVLQCAIYALPVWFQRFVYKKMLRQEI